MQFPVFLRPFFGKMLWRVDTDKKLIYLTFDDGPVPEVTPYVLDILDDYGWKATFFCVGENVQKYPDIYAEILKRGHATANHTYHHLKGFSTNAEMYLKDVQQAAAIVNSDFFRPPHGQLTRKQAELLRSNGHRIVMWDLITYDYDIRQSPDKILRLLQRNLRKGSVVVFHDSIKAKNNVLTVLPKALEYWNANQYQGSLF